MRWRTLLRAVVLSGPAACGTRDMGQAGEPATVTIRSAPTIGSTVQELSPEDSARLSRPRGSSEEDPVPFVETHGYLVRGTDELSFRVCGSPRVHFARMGPGAGNRIMQRYRFESSGLLSPVYFAVKGRIVADTVTVGRHTYHSVIQIVDVLPVSSERRCAAPLPGSLIAPSR